MFGPYQQSTSASTTTTTYTKITTIRSTPNTLRIGALHRDKNDSHGRVLEIDFQETHVQTCAQVGCPPLCQTLEPSSTHPTRPSFHSNQKQRLFTASPTCVLFSDDSECPWKPNQGKSPCGEILPTVLAIFTRS